jgi:transcription elongation factor Elf1
LVTELRCQMGFCSGPVVEDSSFCVRHRPQETPRAKPNPKLVCPHCQVTGQVSMTAAMVKQGISGGKATGAVLTAGVSVLFTGLSRKNEVRRAHCGNCGTSWTVA